MTHDPSHLRIAIGSQNKAKNLAVTTVFERVFTDSVIETRGIDVESGVAAQPTTDEESIQGAINRARNALAQFSLAEYGVGLEGNTVVVADKMFLHGWVAIVHRQSSEVGLGHSSGIELPLSIKQGIEAGDELGPLMQSLMDDTNNTVRHSLGTNGILSGGLYTREQEFIDATTVALARFVQPSLYQ